MHEVREILAQYPPTFQAAQLEPLRNAGGMSGAQFWRITSGDDQFILRRWPVESPTPKRLRFIHAVLTHAATHGLTFLPIPLATRAGASFVQHAGYLWQLDPWMPGSADYNRAPSTEKLRAAMIALAEFHLAVDDFAGPTAPGFAGGSPAVHDRLARLQELAHGGREQLSQAISDKTWPEFAPLARQFLAVLPRALPLAIGLHKSLADESFSLQPCLRDIWHDHVLFTGEQVTGIIDFGAVDIDTPACDVARLLGGLVGDDAAQRKIGLEAYSSVRPLAPNELAAVAAFDTSIVLLSGCNWIRWIYLERREFENPAQVLQIFRRIVERTHMLVST